MEKAKADPLPWVLGLSLAGSLILIGGVGLVLLGGDGAAPSPPPPERGPAPAPSPVFAIFQAAQTLHAAARVTVNPQLRSVFEELAGYVVLGEVAPAGLEQPSANPLESAAAWVTQMMVESRLPSQLVNELAQIGEQVEDADDE